MGRKRRGALLLISAAAAFSSACASHNGDVVIVNKAQESISRVDVHVCRQTIEGKSLQPGDKAQGLFHVNCEGDYGVTVEFSSGKRLHATTGYVTSGLDYSTEISVTDTQIVISKAEFR